MRPSVWSFAALLLAFTGVVNAQGYLDPQGPPAATMVTLGQLHETTLVASNRSDALLALAVHVDWQAFLEIQERIAAMEIPDPAVPPDCICPPHPRPGPLPWLLQTFTNMLADVDALWHHLAPIDFVGQSLSVQVARDQLVALDDYCSAVGELGEELVSAAPVFDGAANVIAEVIPHFQHASNCLGAIDWRDVLKIREDVASTTNMLAALVGVDAVYEPLGPALEAVSNQVARTLQYVSALTGNVTRVGLRMADLDERIQSRLLLMLAVRNEMEANYELVRARQ